MTTKYELNQKLYHRGCSKDYQLKNVFTINHIKEGSRILLSEEGLKYMVNYIKYSEDGSNWYPEETLTPGLNDI